MKSQWWSKECSYIEHVMDKNSQVKEMNYDTATFLRYCEMQRNKAEQEMQYDAMTFIQHVIDDIQGV